MFNDTVYRVCAHVSEPYVNPCFVEYPSPDCIEPGTEILGLYTLLLPLNLTLEWIVINHTVNPYTLLVEEQCEFIGNLQPERLALGQNVLVSEPIDQEALIFVGFHRFASSKDNFILLNLVSLKVLLTCCAFTFGLVVVRRGLSWLVRRMPVAEERVSWNVKVIDIMFYLWVTVVLGVYGNILAISLSKPAVYNYKTVVNVEDLIYCIHRQRCHVIAPASMCYNEPLMVNCSWPSSLEVSVSWPRRLNAAYRRNQPTLYSNDSAESLLNAMEAHRKQFDYPIIIDYGSREADYQTAIKGPKFSHAQRNNLVISRLPELTPTTYAYFYSTALAKPLRKVLRYLFASATIRDTYKKIKDHQSVMHKIAAVGVEQKRLARERDHAPDNQTEEEASSSQVFTKPLSLGQLQDLVYLMTVGTGLGITLLVAEGVRKYYKEGYCCI